MLVALQAAVPPAGLVAVSTCPPPSDTAQKSAFGQDTRLAFRVPGAASARHAAAPPVGFVDERMRPSPSVATQRLTDPHETSVNATGDTRWTRHDPEPAAGSVEVTTLPDQSMPAHSRVD